MNSMKSRKQKWIGISWDKGMCRDVTEGRNRKKINDQQEDDARRYWMI